MRRSTALVLAFAAVLAVLVGADGAGAAPSEKSAASEHRRIVESWTPAARDAAIDRDIVLRGNPRPAAKPAPGGGGGGTTPTTTTGATWTDLNAPVAITTGKVFFRENNVAYVCSGSAVGGTGGPDVVLTAGHCVHGGAGGGFVTDFAFYPNYGKNPANPPFGAWTATALFTTPLWSTGPSTNGPGSKWNDDAGFAVVQQIDANDNPVPLTTLGVVLPQIEFANKGTAAQSSFGYPAARPYTGKTLTYCQGTTNLSYDSNDTYGMACNMTGGSSGGPWLTNMSSKGVGGTITSLNSYGYSSLKNVMFGPIFDTDEGTAFSATWNGACDADEAVPCTSYTG